jgi:Ni,Fe-hydrogenase III large subunit
MPALIDALRDAPRIGAHRPWPRVAVDREIWRAVSGLLADGQAVLLGLWAEKQTVHMALLGEQDGIAVVSLECPQGRFPSVGRLHPPAIRLERTVCDLFGLDAEDAPDVRPWLDHGRWDVRYPIGRQDPPRLGQSYPFLPAEGEGLHQIPVGPVHAGIIEPGHFRFTASGETVVRLEQRLGYVHKGIEQLMSGADLDRAVRLATRASGDSTVAYGFAFSRAVEAAATIEAPARAAWLRALMAELERLANHLGDIGAICNDASFALMHMHCGALRERVLRAAARAFGHRLMMDCVVPGGVTVDLAADGIAAVRAAIEEIQRRFPPLVDLYDNTASLQDRTVSTGRLAPELARQFGAGGFIGRASGRNFDVRRTLTYAPYGALEFAVPLLQEGDVNARVWIRIREIEASLGLIRQILDRLPGGPVRVEVPRRAGEGMALVEGFRGDVLAWTRLDADGRIARCHLRDPSWFQWPLLEAAIEGNIVADFPICNKSFNCSYAGHDL